MNIRIDYDVSDGSRTILINGRLALGYMAIQEGIEPPNGYERIGEVESDTGAKYGFYVLWQ